MLAAAERAFLAAGFGAVTMDAIAREAGVSKATVYAHYMSKEALFGAVVARLSERRFHGFSVEALDPVDIEASLTAIAIRFLDLVLSPEAIALNRIIIAEVSRFPALGVVFWEAGPERTRAQIEGFLRRAAAAGVARNRRTRGLLPSSSSRWRAAKSTCAACCGSKTPATPPGCRKRRSAPSTFFCALSRRANPPLRSLGSVNSNREQGSRVG